MAGFVFPSGEMIVLLTAAYLNEIVLGVYILSLSGQALHMAFAL
jgi:hypothetical protein